MKIVIHPIISLFLISFLSLNLFGQNTIKTEYLDSPAPLTVYDSIGLSNLPKLTLPDKFKGPNALLLPLIVDNSTNIYWRPVFSQVGLECGQASGIGLGFTYEINRVRNLSSELPENQQATHFTWNFGNGGQGWSGVSYFHSFEIVRTLGNPSADIYGGLSAGGGSRWMSGYDNYYNSMKNRLSEVYQIDVSTEEGILTAKNWLHNHLNEDDIGGVANFYASTPGTSHTLPSGTPEEGKYVAISWGGASHAMTISGYHDEICWDYNGDEQYTNNLDINNDNVVDVKDWEIGGFRFANTYSGGPNWANNGFSYMTYKSCADGYGNGGIWNNSLHVVYAKENTSPLLTAKIKIKYNCRNRIRVRMGVSTDQQSETPQYVIGFPIINFQGGCQYMQGGDTNEENKTIEFGLDLTPFLNILGSETPARYFLIVDEVDEESWGSGEIMEFSIMDYTDGLTEIECEQTNVSIINNSQTKVWVDHTVSFEHVTIDMDNLPPATVYEPYSAQLQATGGSYPYFWNKDLNFTETLQSETFPMVDDQQLYPGSGYANKQLDFDFPFYGEEYTSVRVYEDGYIMFENTFGWPYQVYDFLEFTKNKYIAPFMANLTLASGDNDGLWYEGDENSATFRWKASVEGAAATSELNFAVSLSKTGDIKFYYGPVNEFSNLEWISGLSAGDNKYYQFTELSGHPSLNPNIGVSLHASVYPDGFEVSHDGTLSGLALVTYDNYELKVMAKDENNLFASKIVYLSTDGSNYLVIDDFTILSGDDDVIEPGETAYLSVDIKNLGENTITGNSMTIAVDDDLIILVDSTEFLGDFEPDEVKSYSHAFEFDVSAEIPNEYTIDINTLIEDNTGDDWTSHIYLTAFAPEIVLGGISIDDGQNGSLDPGETALMNLTVYNAGGANAIDLIATLSSDDPFITIDNGSSTLANINPYSNDEFTFTITADETVPIGHSIDFEIEYTGFGINGSGTASILIGQTPVLILDMDDNSSSAPGIEQALNDLGVSFETLQDFPTDLNQYTSIFLCLGIYNENHVLSPDQGQLLADYLLNTGNLYMEGGDTWAYDSQTPVHPLFMINGTEDGSGDMSTVLGQENTFTEGMSFNYVGENSWMDHLEPLDTAFVILENQMPEYGTAIAYNAGIYRTIGASHEFGGLSDGAAPSTKEKLMEQYLDFFGVITLDLIPQFNADQTQICNNQTVQFSDYSVGSIASWNWEFEGGAPNTSTQQNPIVLYTTPGLYDVSLIISNGTTSDTITKQNYILVFPNPDIPITPAGDEEVCTNFTFESDYITAGGSNIDDYIWDIQPEEAGVISGNGTTGTVQWTVGWEGTASIRVKGVNNECGESEFSDPFEVFCQICSGIDDLFLSNEISIFPNPSNGELFIKSENKLDNAKISIYNTMNEEVLLFTTDLSKGAIYKIPMDNLPAGLYFIRISALGKERIEKIVLK